MICKGCRLIFKFLQLFLIIELLATGILCADEDLVKINILALNPSASKKLKTTVVHFLPPELKPEDVVDSAGMEIKYDKVKKANFLTKSLGITFSKTSLLKTLSPT